MPRPDKSINSAGRLDDATSSSRGASWTKHGGPESIGGSRGGPSSLEVTVDDITIVETADAPVDEALDRVAAPSEQAPSEQLSKWDQRGTAAHIPIDDARPVAEPVMEWVVLRTIDDRTYHRTDALTVVAGSER
jgi:hypothetical protein